jgi:hypothetical protein
VEGKVEGSDESEFDDASRVTREGSADLMSVVREVREL